LAQAANVQDDCRLSKLTRSFWHGVAPVLGDREQALQRASYRTFAGSPHEPDTNTTALIAMCPDAKCVTNVDDVSEISILISHRL
jgi:hypothetical protein